MIQAMTWSERNKKQSSPGKTKMDEFKRQKLLSFLFIYIIVVWSCIYTEQLREWVSINVKNINRQGNLGTETRWPSQERICNLYFVRTWMGMALEQR
jgi:hypothetical protein